MKAINFRILHAYYTFKVNAPLKGYIKKKLGSVKPRYTLAELLTILKNIIRYEEMFDIRNQAMIICDQELEKALKVKALHVTEIRELVYLQLVRLPDVLQRVLQRRKTLLSQRTPIASTPVIKKLHSMTLRSHKPMEDQTADKSSKNISISPTLDPTIYKDETAIFELKPEFRTALSSLPSFPQTKTLFTYSQICSLMSKYILANAPKLIDPRNVKVLLIKGDPLSLAFKCDSFHRCQVTSFLRKQLIYVMQ